MNLKFNCPFSIIPSHILNDARLDDSTKILFARLISYMNNEHGACSDSNSHLAEISNCKETSVKDRLSLLEKCGYIRRVTKKNGILWDRKIYPILDVYNEVVFKDQILDTENDLDFFYSTFNFIVDKVFRSLSTPEQSILCVILRNTLGNKKQNCILSLSDLTSITGLAKNTVIKSVESLVIKKLITKKLEVVSGQLSSFYSLNGDYFSEDLKNIELEK